MTTSGEATISRDFHVECAETFTINDNTHELGCKFAGIVNVIGDPETDTTWWVCPECELDHYGEFGDFR